MGWTAKAAALLVTGACAAIGAAQSFPDQVVSFTPGPNAGFGVGNMPGNVLGAPNGNENPQTPTFDQAHLVSLGTGGQIVLEFTATEIVDGPGADFTVFENPVQPAHDANQSFVDSAVVAVSNDGNNWTTFPFNIVSTEQSQLVYKANYLGFAGVIPSLSSPTNGRSPFIPAQSGGDQFDLSTVGLQKARFIRINDTGTTTVAATADPDVDIVNDYVNLIDPNPQQPGLGISAGFDLDAIAAIHSQPRTVSAVRREEWELYE